MGGQYLFREDAPWDAKLWEELDKAVIGAAKTFLTGRRLVQVDGPYGLGLQNVTKGEVEIEPGITAGTSLPVFHLFQTCRVYKRDIAAYEREGIMPPLEEVVRASLECARREDDIIFHGKQTVRGLFTIEGVRTIGLSSWDQVGNAADDVIKAVTELDTAGFHGPYALALSPHKFNSLFRLYDRGNLSELDHIRHIATDSIYKAPILEKGGVLIATNPGLTTLVLGQDLMLGFIGVTPESVELVLSETFSLIIRAPESICVLTE